MLNLSFNFINRLKRRFFPFYKNKDLKNIFEKLQKGYSEEIVVARFVGGCVRKYLTGEAVDDIDIATILTSDEIKQRFQNTNFKIIETGVKHGTITLISDNHKLELTTLRKDLQTDGRHAEVEYIDNWKLDSERRDFTINAIYLDIKGKIFDPQNGTLDLKNNNVKFIGDPQKRIEEDYLRIIRFLRFSIQYDSVADNTTIEALKLNLNGVNKISKERILDELFKILKLSNFKNVMKNDNRKLIFSLIFPELKYLDRLQKLNKPDINSRVKIENLLAILLIDEKENHEYFSHKYRVSNDIKDSLNLIAENFKTLKKDKNFLNKNLEKNIYLYGKKHLKILCQLEFLINKKYVFQNFINLLKKISKSETHKFPYDGKYLKKHGMKEGLALGRVIKILEKEWVENNFKISNERVLEVIKQNLN
tara:strand:+ start:53 stop:1315 length:1263 start_codon:yes stop_codon:yes gene_type:complete